MISQLHVNSGAISWGTWVVVLSPGPRLPMVSTSGLGAGLLWLYSCSWPHHRLGGKLLISPHCPKHGVQEDLSACGKLLVKDKKSGVRFQKYDGKVFWESYSLLPAIKPGGKDGVLGERPYARLRGWVTLGCLGLGTPGFSWYHNQGGLPRHG